MFKAKEILENELKVKIYSLAYPYGDYGQRSLNFPKAKNILPKIAKKYYPVAFYQINPHRNFIENFTGQDIHFSKRVSVKPEWRPSELVELIDSSQVKQLPFADNFIKNKGWKKTYGNLEFKNGELNLDTNNMKNTGNSVFLDGTMLWKDYIFRAYLRWERGSNISLISKYRDDLNYLACNFTDDGIILEELNEGEKTILEEIKYELSIDKSDFKAGIKIDDENIECLLNEEVILSNKYESSSLTGGIGIKTWDKTLGNSKLIVKKVLVYKK